ncbi:MAG TPA: hypothetical protein VF600_01440 [Abditibacteriaceae bacterium]|jgi:hypothetical protein
MKRLSSSKKQRAVARFAAWLPLIGLAGVLGAGCGGGEKKEDDLTGTYGAKVKYVEGEKVQFPDFILKYMGTSQEKDKNFPSGVTVYNFRVRKGDERRSIGWVAASKPAPLKFKFQEGEYSLERVNSQKLGKLADDEVVVWKLGNNQS